MPLRVVRHVATIAVTLAAQPIGAQINEYDRLARCQNNFAELSRLQTALQNYSTPDQIARARIALISIRKLDEKIAASFVEEETRAYDFRRQSRKATSESEHRSYQMRIESNRYYYNKLRLDLVRQKEQVGREVNYVCGSQNQDINCLSEMQQRLGRAIDAAVAQLPQYNQIQKQIAVHRTNLAALRCDQSSQQGASAAVSVASLAGGWQGGNGSGSYYTFSQNGTAVSWTRSDSDEVGTASVSGNSISASYRSSYGSGSADGTIEFDGTGRAARIRWSNGDVYVRR